MMDNAKDELLRKLLAAAADEVFDVLFADDLAALLDRYGSRTGLREAVVKPGGKVVAKLAGTSDAVPHQEYPLVVAACLTWGRHQAGVAQNPRHAAKKFLRYRRCARLPIGVLVRTDRVVPDDDWTITVLARALRVRAEIMDAGQSGEPELILNMVVPAIVAALAQSCGADEAALTDATRAVLSRGAELAAVH